jgi:hypothetical protein
LVLPRACTIGIANVNGYQTRNFPPRSASWIEEMEKRSHRRIRDLVAHTAFKGLVANEIGCARISMMAGSKTLPSKGRIQKRETNYLQINSSGLQRTAGPYRCAMYGRRPRCKRNLTFREAFGCSHVSGL